MKRFVNVGFEFTAGVKKGGRVKSKILRRRSFSNNIVRQDTKTKLSEYKWINKHFDTDDCGCEVATPILTKKSEIPLVFNHFISFVKEHDLTIDINKAMCGLGGCHIHMGIGFMPIPFRTRFIKNIGTFMTNNPQLNWGFNDVNDNINANSLLTHSYRKDVVSFMLHYKNDIETSCYTKGHGHLLTSFDNQSCPYNAFMSNPIKILLYKKFAIRYNPFYKTIELRIFDMPKNLKLHMLHYDVAMAIFNYCYKATKAKKDFKLEYTDWTDYIHEESVEQSIIKFNKCMEKLGIASNRLNLMRNNIRTRHSWTNKKNCYLY